MSELADRVLTVETPRRRWPVPFTWLGLIAVAWALYELTAQPALGAMALCVKLGWDDFRTALWLRSRDPSRKRSLTCFWLYLANGAWKVSAGAVLACEVILLVAVHRQGGQLGKQTEEVLLGTALTVGFGWLLSLLASLCAVWLAWRHGVRLWLHSAVHHAWQADVWPPHQYRAGRRNRLDRLFFPQFLLAAIALALLALIALIAVGDVLVVFIGSGCLIAASCALGHYFRDISLESLKAQTPEQCWEVVVGDERGDVEE